MGNSNKAANPVGEIVVQIEKSLYLPGDTVSGHIYLQLHKDVSGGQLFLKVKGKEDTKWLVRHPTHYDKEAEKNGQVKRRGKIQLGHNAFLNYKVPVYQCEQPQMKAGQYCIPFSLLLPQNLPGSFSEMLSSKRGHAQIVYKLKAELFSEGGARQIKGSSPLWVREPAARQVESQNRNSDVPITFCWCSAGFAHLDCHFDKNAYMPGETANIICEIDNRLSKREIKSLICTLKYQISMANEINSNTISGTLSQSVLPGIGAGQSALGAERKVFNLPIMAKRNSQGLFQATTNGRLVQCTYTLEVQCVLEGFRGCSEFPQVNVPVTIYFPDPEMERIQPPANWQPKQIPLVNLDLNKKYQYQSKKVDAAIREYVEEPELEPEPKSPINNQIPAPHSPEQPGQRMMLPVAPPLSPHNHDISTQQPPAHPTPLQSHLNDAQQQMIMNEQGPPEMAYPVGLKMSHPSYLEYSLKDLKERASEKTGVSPTGRPEMIEPYVTTRTSL